MDWMIWTPSPAIESWPWPIHPTSTVAGFTFKTNPVPAARARSQIGQRPFTPEPYRSYLKELGWLVSYEYKGPVLDVALGIRAFFFRSTRRQVDRDNLAKAVQDAGKGIVWADDSQIVEGFDRVFYDPAHPRTEVLIYRTLA